MLIGKTFDPSPAVYAWQHSANRLADEVRNTWLTNKKCGLPAWEETFSEDPGALPGLREEGFHNLVGLDYIFRWWGADSEDAMAGEVNVLWKILQDDPAKPLSCYKTWIRLDEQDFILGVFGTETKKREKSREEFRKAFEAWKELYPFTAQ